MALGIFSSSLPMCSRFIGAALACAACSTPAVSSPPAHDATAAPGGFEAEPNPRKPTCFVGELNQVSDSVALTELEQRPEQYLGRVVQTTGRLLHAYERPGLVDLATKTYVVAFWGDLDVRWCRNKTVTVIGTLMRAHPHNRTDYVFNISTMRAIAE